MILDNRRCHHADPIRHHIEQRGAQLLFLPNYSPGLSPIEEAFAKVKAGLRRLKADTFDAFLDALQGSLDSVSTQDALNWHFNSSQQNTTISNLASKVYGTIATLISQVGQFQ